MKTVEALDLYQRYKAGSDVSSLVSSRLQIHGIATKVGPDPYALPSVELAESVGSHSRVLCVLPLQDYLKLRHVRKGDEVTIEGQPVGFAPGKLDYVVVKRCKIIAVNAQQ